MAKLINGHFSWDVRFLESDRRLRYHVRFIFGGASIINPVLMDQDFFILDEFGDNLHNSLFQALKKVLETEKRATWAPSGYDVFLEIVPQPARGECLLEFYIAFEGGLEKKSIKKGKTRSGVIILRMTIKKAKLQEFYKKLQKEYKKVDNLYAEGISITKDKKISILEKQFDQAMRDIYIKGKRHRVEGDTLIDLVEKLGGRWAAKYILRSLGSRSVIRKLLVAQVFEVKDLNLFVESLVADPKWEALFTPEEIKIAKDRLDQWKIK